MASYKSISQAGYYLNEFWIVPCMKIPGTRPFCHISDFLNNFPIVAASHTILVFPGVGTSMHPGVEWHAMGPHAKRAIRKKVCLFLRRPTGYGPEQLSRSVVLG